MNSLHKTVDIFCISLGIEKENNDSLYRICNDLNISAYKVNCFLHTTLFQGATVSRGKIIKWAQSGKSAIRDIATLRSLKIWDKRIKDIGSLYTGRFDNRLQAICLEHRNSNYIRCLSQKILEDLKEECLIVDINDLNLHSNLNFNTKYAIDYQYSAQAGNIVPHTTLGFIDSSELTRSKKDALLDSLQRININHSAIYITSLNEYCMTPLVGRHKVIDLY